MGEVASPVVIDTSVLIADLVPQIEGPIKVSAVTLAELQLGADLARDQMVRSARLAKLAEVRRDFGVLKVDATVAASYGLVAARVALSGGKVRPRRFDLLIAATAHAHGAIVVTSDIRGFAGLEGIVEVVNI